MTRIDPTKSYSVYQIVQEGWLGKYWPTVRGKIMRDQLEGNILKVTSTGSGTSRRYSPIFGANLVKYLKAQKEV